MITDLEKERYAVEICQPPSTVKYLASQRFSTPAAAQNYANKLLKIDNKQTVKVYDTIKRETL